MRKGVLNMDEKKKEEQSKRIQEGMYSPGGFLTGLLFICVLEAYFLGELDDCFNGFDPIWSEIPSFIGGLLSMAFFNALVAGLGMGAYSALREVIRGEGKIWSVVRAIGAVAMAVFFAGIVFHSCGRTGV